MTDGATLVSPRLRNKHGHHVLRKGNEITIYFLSSLDSANMSEESAFSRVANEVLQAVDHLSTRMEEGLSVLLTGNLPEEEEASTGNQEIPKDDLEFDGDISDEDLDQLLNEGMMNDSPLGGIADSVISDIMANQGAGPSSPLEHFHAFRSAITWSETFIQCLITFQITMFLICMWVSRKDRGLTPRVSVMILIGVIVRLAERLNDFGAKHWRTFATQNYFDKGGIFILIMLCAPLLFDCMIMLVMYIREAGQLLVKVKREEIKRKKGTQNKKETSKKTKKGSTKKTN